MSGARRDTRRGDGTQANRPKSGTSEEDFGAPSKDSSAFWNRRRLNVPKEKSPKKEGSILIKTKLSPNMTGIPKSGTSEEDFGARSKDLSAERTRHFSNVERERSQKEQASTSNRTRLSPYMTRIPKSGTSEEKFGARSKDLSAERTLRLSNVERERSQKQQALTSSRTRLSPNMTRIPKSRISEEDFGAPNEDLSAERTRRFSNVEREKSQKEQASTSNKTRLSPNMTRIPKSGTSEEDFGARSKDLSAERTRRFSNVERERSQKEQASTSNRTRLSPNMTRIPKSDSSEEDFGARSNDRSPVRTRQFSNDERERSPKKEQASISSSTWLSPQMKAYAELRTKTPSPSENIRQRRKLPPTPTSDKDKNLPSVNITPQSSRKRRRRVRSAPNKPKSYSSEDEFETSSKDSSPEMMARNKREIKEVRAQREQVLISDKTKNFPNLETNKPFCLGSSVSEQTRKRRLPDLSPSKIKTSRSANIALKSPNTAAQKTDISDIPCFVDEPKRKTIPEKKDEAQCEPFVVTKPETKSTSPHITEVTGAPSPGDKSKPAIMERILNKFFRRPEARHENKSLIEHMRIGEKSFHKYCQNVAGFGGYVKKAVISRAPNYPNTMSTSPRVSVRPLSPESSSSAATAEFMIPPTVRSRQERLNPPVFKKVNINKIKKIRGDKEDKDADVSKLAEDMKHSLQFGSSQARSVVPRSSAQIQVPDDAIGGRDLDHRADLSLPLSGDRTEIPAGAIGGRNVLESPLHSSSAVIYSSAQVEVPAGATGGSKLCHFPKVGESPEKKSSQKRNPLRRQKNFEEDEPPCENLDDTNKEISSTDSELIFKKMSPRSPRKTP